MSEEPLLQGAKALVPCAGYSDDITRESPPLPTPLPPTPKPKISRACSPGRGAGKQRKEKKGASERQASKDGCAGKRVLYFFLFCRK